MFGDKINLLLPQRQLVDTINGLYMVEANSKDIKECVLFLFSDCVVVAIDFGSID
jgi:hypothetical protein